MLMLEKRMVLSELREEIEFSDVRELELDEIEEDEILDKLLSFESKEERSYPERSELSLLISGLFPGTTGSKPPSKLRRRPSISRRRLLHLKL